MRERVNESEREKRGERKCRKIETLKCLCRENTCL
jgi:hypothetical protein